MKAQEAIPKKAETASHGAEAQEAGGKVLQCRVFIHKGTQGRRLLFPETVLQGQALCLHPAKIPI